jgi:hypothetical protein
MPFYYCPRSFVSKMVSISRNGTMREKVYKTTIGGEEEEGDSKGEVYQK